MTTSVDLAVAIGPTGALDLAPQGGTVSGRRCLALALLRRLTTRPGGLLLHPGYGYDVRALRARGLRPGEVAAAQAAIGAQVRRDERVLSATATVTLDAARSALAVRVAVTDQAGPFVLVIPLTAGAVATILDGAVP